MNTFNNFRKAMKTSRIIKLLGVVCFLAYSFSALAQDTIWFEWAATAGQTKSFHIEATNGNFTVHWGDGADNTYTGNSITPSHNYATADTYTVTIAANGLCRLTWFTCNSQSVNNLDVSNCTALTYLECNFNSLVNLDVSKNPMLSILYCGFNSLDSLDVSNNTALTQLYCGGNSLVNLDVSQNTNLRFLQCYGNSLVNLNVSNNTKLQEIRCNDNSLVNLDVSNCTVLSYFECANNSLVNLDVSQNPLQEGLWCFNNHLPLSELYPASLKTYNKYVEPRLGPQTLHPQTVTTGTSVDFSSQIKFGDPATLTSFVLEKDGIPAKNYMVTGEGMFAFYDTGVYIIKMTNAAIQSFVSYPAVVSVEITVLPGAGIGTTAVTAKAGYGGAITPSGGAGSYTITPNADYVIDQIFVDEVSITVPDRTTHTVPIADDGMFHTIFVTFGYTVNY